MAKIKVAFEGFEQAVKRVENLGGNVKNITEKALKESHAHVTPGVKQAVRPHKLTGQTECALVETADVRWAGTVATVPVGFDIKHGGLASIFLMYGTPKMAKDQKLYDAIYGKKIEREIHKIQAEVFYNEIGRLM